MIGVVISINVMINGMNMTGRHDKTKQLIVKWLINRFLRTIYSTYLNIHK